MNEAEILAYQREQFEAKGMSPAEIDRVFGTGAWSYETRVASEEAGDPYPFVPGGAEQLGMVSPVPVPLPAPVPMPLVVKTGGTLMAYNGAGVLPGAAPPASLMVMTNGAGIVPAGQSEISIPGLMVILALGRGLFLGWIRALIAKVGWQPILSVLGTALAAKVLAMLNDGGSDDRDVLTAGGPGGVGVTIVKRWRANNTNFWMDSAGYMYAERRNGVIKRWKPKKPIVLVRGRTTLAGAVKAQRYLDHLWRTVAKRTKALKLA